MAAAVAGSSDARPATPSGPDRPFRNATLDSPPSATRPSTAARRPPRAAS
jgi:hypothetical protein